MDSVDWPSLGLFQKVGERLIELCPGRRDGSDPIGQQGEPTARSQERGDFLERGVRLHPVERLGRNNEIERSVVRFPVLERRLLDVDAVGRRHVRHAGVRFYCEYLGARIPQLHRCDSRSRPDVKYTHVLAVNQLNNEAAWVTRAETVVVVRNKTKRVRPAAVGMARSVHMSRMR
ncbi:hypothetical protein MHPYR_60028 [uncultured Mycobacterium sp.]|uniref:Uncharacterized protein n=1 Tax=uncultured Mycobacterium sp. TaxID=171292 RepID=A0A1Y5PMB9_9MYCO|nr:hypothetical protein MHPYR_60028 [uncultured Mycobacterium sp.]